MTSFMRFVVAAPALAVLSGGPTIKDLAFRGAMSPSGQQLNATIVTAVHSPFGKIPVGGRVRATYACDGTISGTVSYSGIIRFLARIKGVTLVSVVDASIAVPPAWDCVGTRDSIVAQFAVSDTVVAGVVRFGGDSASLGGVVKTEGGVYDLLLVATRDNRLDTARVKIR